MLLTTRFALRRGIVSLSLAACVSPNSFAQLPTISEEAKDVLRLSEAAQRHFVESVLERKFPQEEGDKFSILLVNRSALVVPALELRIGYEMNRSPRSEGFIDLASAMIAYAGDEESLRAVSRLIGRDEHRFGRLVGRTLDNAGSWRNPFSVVYGAFDLGDDRLVRYAIDWADSALEWVRAQRKWAEAMRDRYGKIPGPSEWANDPIASRLKAARASALRDRVLGIASELQRSRDRSQ